MLAAPGAHFGWVEDAVVIRVHLVELRRCAASRALLGSFDKLLPSEAAGRGRCRGRGSRAWLSRGLLGYLGESGRRQQRKGEDSEDGSRAHIVRPLVVDIDFVPYHACKHNPPRPPQQGCVRFMSRRQKSTA